MTSKADMGVSDLVITAEKQMLVNKSTSSPQLRSDPTAVRVKMRISVTIFSEFAPGLCVPGRAVITNESH